MKTDPEKHFIMLLTLNSRSSIKFTGMTHLLKAKYILRALEKLDLNVKYSDKTGFKINKSKG